MPIGIYISVPFCRTKCSYCNFASDVFSRAVFERYTERLCADIESARATATAMSGYFDPAVDSIYLGGGTPSILESHQLERLFVTIRQNFCLTSDAEITVECAPGTLTPGILDVLSSCGVNRVSLGVQSYVDRETSGVGRLHKRATVLKDLANLRACGISNINIDLIAGLPHQTAETWRYSLSEALASAVPHVSVYMLEVDEDSRLGRELIAGGAKYHAHFVPDEELTADLYSEACNQLTAAGVSQYEISNFARENRRSRHNLKYWTRQPYLGFGVDAHSMLPACGSELDAVRFASPDTLDSFLAGRPLSRAGVSRHAAFEEVFFLGLRLVDGIDLRQQTERFGEDAVRRVVPILEKQAALGLIDREHDAVKLTHRGRLLSNEVFQAFLSEPTVAVA